MATEKVQIVIEGHDGLAKPAQSGKKALAELEGAAKQTTKSLGGLGGVIDGLGKLGLAGMGISAITGAAKGLADTLGLNLNVEMENVQAQLNAFTKDGAKSAAILADIRKEADKTPFAFAEMAKATAGLMSSAKQANQPLMDLVRDAEILAASNPAQGLEGAAFALREAVSGDFTSIIERFNLPRSYINKLKEEGVPALEVVRRAMKEMGYDSDLVSNLAKTASGRWSTFMDTIDGIKVKLSKPIFDFLSQQLSNLQGLFDDNKENIDAFVSTLGGMLGSAAQIAGDWLGKLRDTLISVFDAGKMLFTGDFQGGIFGLEEDDPIVITLLTIHDTIDSLIGVFTGAEGAGLRLHNLLEQMVGLDVANFLILAVQGVQALIEAIKGLIPEPVQTFIADMVKAVEQSGLLNVALDVLVGVINAVARGIVALTKFIGDNKAAQSALVGVLAMATTIYIGLKAIALGHAVAMGIQTVATNALAVAQGLLNIIMTANPIGIVIVALAGLAAGLIYAYNTSDEFRAIVDGAFKAVTETFNNLWLTAQNVFIQLQGAFDSVGDVIGTVGGTISAYLQLLQFQIGVTWYNIKATVIGAINAVVEFIRAGWERAQQFVSDALDTIKSIITNIWHAIPEDIRRDLQLIASVLLQRFTGFIASIAGWLNEIKTNVETVWKNILISIQKVLTSIRDNVITPILDAISGIIKEVWTTITDTAEKVWDFYAGIIDRAWTYIRDSVITPILNSIARIIDGVWTTIQDAAGKAWESFKGIIAGKVGEGAGVLGVITQFVTDILAKLRNLATDIARKAGEIGGAIIQGIKDGINAGWQMLIDMVWDLARSLINAAKRALGIASPSKLFAEIGEQMGTGIIMGIDSMAGRVRRSVLGMTAIPTRNVSSPLPQTGNSIMSSTLAMLAANNRPEAVVPLGGRVGNVGGMTVNLYVQGSVVTERELVDTFRREIFRIQDRNINSGFAGT